jgi:hypothetical protein
MANWSLPTLTSTYTNFLTEVKNRDTDLALQFDGTTSTNLSTGTIRWNSTANRWQKWSGSAWAELTTTYALTGLSTTGAASIGTTLGVTGVATLSGGGTSTTPATDNNTTNIATTAFVVGQASATTPLMAGTAAVGTSLRYARQDHRHPTDTTRAPLASPTFTGTVTIPVGASISGYLTTATAGTTYAPLASPALTGTPTAPTATAGTNNTQIATTSFVSTSFAPKASPTFTGTTNFASAIGSGPLWLGTTSSIAHSGTTADLQVAAIGSDAAGSFTRYSTTNAGGQLVLARSAGTTVGTHGLVAGGAVLGELNFQGSDGVAFQRGAFVRALTEFGTTPAVGSMPTRLSFGTTPDGSVTALFRLAITPTGQIYNHGDDAFGIQSKTSKAANNTTDQLLTLYNNAATFSSVGTACWRVWTNGDTHNQNNSYGALSDVKLKENIIDATSQWDDLKALRVRKYNFKAETGNQTHTQIGLVAQEVEQVSPGLVSATIDRDEDGNELETVTKAVNYSVLYMKAIKALQEAMERIETLEARLTAAGIA